jgi:hypothetical protein
MHHTADVKIPKIKENPYNLFPLICFRDDCPNDEKIEYVIDLI